MYCYIEKYNTQFEQPKALKLHYYDSLLPDGFHLASLGMIGIEKTNMPGFFSVSEFLEKNAYIYSMHKTTYTEAHYILKDHGKILNKIPNDKDKNGLNTFGLLATALEEHKKKVENSVRGNMIEHHNEMENPDKNVFVYKTYIHRKYSLDMCRQSIIALKYVITNIESKNESNLLPKVFKKMRQNCQCLEEIEKTLLEEENVNRKQGKLPNKIHAEHIKVVKHVRQTFGEYVDTISYRVLKLKDSLKSLKTIQKMLVGLISFYDKAENVFHEEFDEAFLLKTKKEFDELLKKKLDNLVLNWEAILDENLKEVEEKHALEANVVHDSNSSIHASKNNEVGESSGHADIHLQPKPSFDKEGLKQIFTGLGKYFVNFCFAQRFLQTFNEQGTVKMSSFIKNDADQEYGLKLYDMMDREILNTEFYQTIKNEIENFLKSKCNSLGTAKKENECNAFLKDMLLKWHGYCSMDTANLESERFEELELVK
uniref:Uncharacterized protein n=1 Tax=Meloidogyne enterolobii TaxID=390850 RepID=A0A6V7UHH9_MELEN|nr:unnamed protein product [Meloidogyne enterolobii]